MGNSHRLLLLKKSADQVRRFLASFCILTVFFLSGSMGVLLAADPVASPEATGTSTVEGDAASNNITLDFKEADINTVLRVMSLKSKVNIVAGPEVQGTITIRLENVPWEKALEVVLRTYGYVFERDGNIIRVTTRENLAQEPVLTETYVLNYTKAAEVQTAVQDILTERGRIKTAERTNALVITDIPTNLYHIGEVIKKLDKITPQAYVDSKIVNTALSEAENMGIEWKTGGTSNNLGSLTGAGRPETFPFVDGRKSTGSSALEQFFPLTAGALAANAVDPRGFPTDNSTLGATGGAFNYGTLTFTGFNAILQMLKSRSNTKVISNPRIVVLNNQAAKVQVGSQIPLPNFERNQTTGAVEVTGYNYRDVGVVLNVTPHINSQEEILVDLKPEVSSNAGNINFGAFQIPFFSITTAVTQVLIRSGETIAIGGLLTDNATSAEAKVPYLGDVPYLGKLFRSKRQDPTANSKAETIFFVTVTLVDTEGQPTGELAAKRDKARQEHLQSAASLDKQTPKSAIESTTAAPQTVQATDAAPVQQAPAQV